MVWNRAGAIVALCIAATLSACGGGGSSTATIQPSNTSADPLDQVEDLGLTGHAVGTVDLGAAALPGSANSGTPLVAVAMSEENRALAVWQIMAPLPADKSAAWAQTSDTGIWGPSNALPQARNSYSILNLTLRMNKAGNAVLGWISQGSVAPNDEVAGYRAARFIQGRGWDSQPYDVSGSSSVAASYANTDSWDLTMLDDDSFTSSVRTLASELYTSAVQRTDRDGHQTTSLQLTNRNSQNLHTSLFTVNPDSGLGLLYQMADSETQPWFTEIRARLASVYSGALDAFPIGAYNGGICFPESYDSGLVGAITPRAEGVLTVLAPGAATNGGFTSCDYHDLQVIRVYTASSIRVESTRLNAIGTFLPAPPIVAMDNLGNALVVWKETTGERFYPSAPSKTRLMWSQSLYGGPWSKPSMLDSSLSSLGTIRRSGNISLAMNASGEAVASIKVDGLVNSAMNQSIVVGRFNFTNGWTKWRAVANKQGMSDPKVAINSSGKAVLAYTAQTAQRVNGQAPTIVTPTEALARAFAYSF